MVRMTFVYSPLTTHRSFLTCSISYQKKQCGAPKVTALHLLTHRIVFANAPHCVFSLTAHLPVMLNSFQHLSAVMF